jgi:VCBS repeat-containing protein
MLLRMGWRLGRQGNLQAMASRGAVSDGLPVAPVKLHHDGSGSVQIADPEALFLGDYSRHGYDLVIQHGGTTLLIEDYFAGAGANLVGPNGAFLTPGVVKALAGPMAPGQYAQAASTSPDAPAATGLTEIGKVVSIEGTATATHKDGVTVDLAKDAPVYQGDVISTGEGSKLGVVFIDDSVFSMSASARMVLDELIFDPAKAADSSMVINLVQGSFVFVTGKVAPAGDMKVETPVATMGIRGTTPTADINAGLGVMTFGILPNPEDGKIGSYLLLDKVTGEILGTVESVGDKWVITSLSGEAVKVAKSGVDLLEDEALMADIRDAVSSALGDRTQYNGSNAYKQVAYDSSASAGSHGDGTGDDGGSGGPGGGGGIVDSNPDTDDPPDARDDAFSTNEDLGIVANVINASGGGPDFDPEGFPVTVIQVNGSTLTFTLNNAYVPLPVDWPRQTVSADLVISKTGGITFDPTSAFDFLAVGERAIETFTYTISDQFGFTDTATVRITVDGRNDAPVITDGPVSTTLAESSEAGGVGGAFSGGPTTGTIALNDVDISDTGHTYQVVSVVETPNGGAPPNPLGGAALQGMLSLAGSSDSGSTGTAGTIVWTFVGTEDQFDYLALGETVTLVYTVQVTDPHGATDTQTVTVTIVGAAEDGSNDEPVILAPTDVSETRAETELSLTTSGSFDVGDVDITDVVSITGVTVATSGNDTDAALPNNATLLGMFSPQSGVVIGNTATTGTVNWTFNGGTDAFDYLAVGESLTLTYTVTIKDDNNASVTQDVTITVTGTNDAPTITAATDVSDTLAETEGALSTTGSFVVSDVDTTDVVSITGVTVATSGKGSDAALPDNATLLGMFSPQSGVAINGSSNSGTVNWTFNGGTDAFDYLAVGESLTLTYTVTLADDNIPPGTVTQDVTITVTGTNDAPTITAATDVSDTLAETEGPLSTTGSFVVGDVDTTDVVSITGVTVATSGNDSDAALPDNATLLGMFSPQSGVAINGSSNSGTVNWTFNGGTDAFDYLAVGESLTLTYTVTIKDDNNASVTQDVTITVTGTNDAPVLAVEATGGVTEDAASPTLTDSGTLSFTDVDTTDTHTIASTPLGAPVWSGGDLSTVLPTTDIPALVDGFSVDADSWDYSAANSLVQFLAEGETITLQYTVSVTDDSGVAPTNSDSDVVTITINGTNDDPVVAATDVTGGVTELTPEDTPVAFLTDTGTIDFTDADVTDVHTIDPTVTPSAGVLGTLTASVTTDTTGTGTGGVITWNYSVDPALVEDLEEAETKEETFTITLDDGNGGSIERTITVTITGTDDGGNSRPVLTVDQSGGVTEDAASPTLSDSGTLSFTDANGLDTHTTGSVLLGDAVWSGGDLATVLSPTDIQTLVDGFTVDADSWDYAAPNALVQFLGEGETITLQYTVSVTDDSGAANATDSEVVTVTITGTNDDPVVEVTDVAGAATELEAPSGDLTDSGTITFTDVDLTDVHGVSPTGEFVGDGLPVGALTASVTTDTTGTGTGGVITWSYSVAAADVEFLADGETLEEIFRITIDDGNGGEIERDITVTITGTNDAPVLTVDASGGVTEDATSPTLGDSGTLSFTDVDFTDTHTTASTPLGDAVWSDGDLSTVLSPTDIQALVDGFTVDADSWDYSVANSLVQFLAEGETITLEYTVTVMDDSGVALSNSDSEVVTVTITGNDAPTISSQYQVSVDFAEIASAGSGVQIVGNEHVADGFRFVGYAPAAGQNALGTMGSGTAPSAYPGSAALLNRYPEGYTEFSRVDDAPFKLVSIDLSESNDSQLTGTFTITGTTSTGATVVQTVVRDGTFGFQTVALTGFDDIVTVRIDGDNGKGYQIDNIVADVVDAQTAALAELTDTDTDENDYEHSTSGTIAFSDVDTSDTHTVSADPAVGNPIDVLSATFTLTNPGTVNADGNVGWEFTVNDADFDFLAEGETRAFTYMVTIDDGNGGSATQIVTITITGTNDAPTITASTADAAEDGPTVDVDLAALGADVDSNDDGSTLSYGIVTQPSEGSASIAGSTLTFDPGSDFQDLAVGETRQVTVQVQATDAHGAASNVVDIVVTVIGTNDDPIINATDVERTVAEDGTLSAGSSFSFADVDLSDRPDVLVTNAAFDARDANNDTFDLTPGQQEAFEAAFSAALGSGSLNDGTVEWSFDLDGIDLSFLGEDESVTAVFTVTVDDQNGGTTNQDITVTINGAGSGDRDDELFGTAGDDFLAGGLGNDTLHGLDGSDHLEGGDGNDTLNGGEGDDYLVGGAGTDIYDGGGSGQDQWDMISFREETGSFGVIANLDTGYVRDTYGNIETATGIEEVDGSDNADVLIGNDLDNFFRGYDGADSFDGGDGWDQVAYDTEQGGQGIDVDLSAGSGTDTYGNTDTFVSIESVRGSEWNDTIVGDGNDNQFRGMAGDDIIDGGDGWDEVRYDRDANYEGGQNGVTVNLATGTATDGFGNTDTLSNIEAVRGTQFADTLIGDNNGNRLEGLGGNDTLDGGGGNDDLIGGDGNDTLIGGQGDDWLIGGKGTDTYIGGDGPDQWDGMSFEDETGAGGVFVNLATGAVMDTYGNIESATGIEDVDGSQNDDILIGNAGENFFRGFDGADTYEGGGSQWDIVSYEREDGGQGVVINLSVLDGNGYATGTDTYGNVEKLKGIANLRGSAWGDTFTGDSGDNEFQALAGNDVLDGGDGWDTVRYDRDVRFGGNAGVVVDLANNTATDGFGHTDTLSNIEAAWGTDGDDVLIGNDEDNQFLGLGGDDEIDGGGTEDWDNAAYWRANSGIHVDLTLVSGQVVDDGMGGTDTLINIESISGSDHADVMIGNDDSNHFYGGGGDDLLMGGDGDDQDWLEGNGGNDTLIGGDGTGGDWDTAAYWSAQAGIVVDMTRGEGQVIRDGDGGTDTLIGIENISGSQHADTIVGNWQDNGYRGESGDDLLIGGSGNELIVGGDGNDTIDGGFGDDYLVGDDQEGGSGADRFIFAPGSGQDTIEDFDVAGGDRLDIQAFGYASVADITGNGGTIIAGTDTVIVFGSGEQITLLAFNISTLSDPNDAFIFSGSPNPIQGTDGDDLLFGTSGNDYIETLDATEGDGDQIYGSFGNDTIDFAGSVDAWHQLSYWTFGDGIGLDVTIGAATGAIVIEGFYTHTLVNLDQIDGQVGGLGIYLGFGGDDTFDIDTSGVEWIEIGAGGGQDTLAVSGTGVLRVAFDNYNGVEIDAVNGVVTEINGDSTLTVTSGFVAEWHGSRGDDSFLGTGGNELFITNGGDNTVDGGGGFDRVRYDRNGVSGLKVVYSAQGSATVTGIWNDQAFTDTLTNVEHVRGAREGVTQFVGSAGAETFEARGGVNDFNGGGGNDVLIAGGEGNLFSFAPDSGQDTIEKFEIGRDVIDLSAYNFADENSFGSFTFDGSDTIIDLNGTDTVTVVGRNLTTADPTEIFIFEGDPGTSGNDDLLGTSGNDVLRSGGQVLDETGEDILDGGDGDDVLIAEGGFVKMVGGQGDDTFVSVRNDDWWDFARADYRNSPQNVGIVANLSASIFMGVGLMQVADGYGTTDTVYGIHGIDDSAGNDHIRVDGSYRTANGVNELDVRLTGGDDTVDFTGADHSVRVNYRDAADGVIVDLAAGTAVDANTRLSHASQDDIGSDTLINVEHVRGSSFADTLTGDGDDNRFRGHAGDDIIDGGDGWDIAEYYNSDSGIVVDLNLGTGQVTNDGFGDIDTLIDIEVVAGSAYADQMTGDGGDNEFWGDFGDDILIGGGGNDVLIGGWQDFAGLLDGDDVLDGGDGDDYLEGSDGNDTLLGGADNDQLFGGNGSDQLTGGDGDDDFLLYAGETGVDEILDFGNGDDAIILIGYSDTADIQFVGVGADYNVMVDSQLVATLDNYTSGIQAEYDYEAQYHVISAAV